MSHKCTHTPEKPKNGCNGVAYHKFGDMSKCQKEFIDSHPIEPQKLRGVISLTFPNGELYSFTGIKTNEDGTTTLLGIEQVNKISIEPQKENNCEEKLNKKLTELIDSGEIDEGIWIQNEIKDLVNQTLKEKMDRVEKYLTDLEATYNTEKTQDYKGIVTEIKRYLFGISKENE